MASAYVKYFQFVEDLAQKVHDLLGAAGTDADTCKLALSNTAGDVVQTLSTLSQVTQIPATGGYATKSVQNVGVRASGVVTVTGTTVTFTATGASMGPFRYIILYNDTPTSPADPLIASWDYGTPLTLLDGESLSIRFNNGLASGTLFTLS